MISEAFMICGTSIFGRWREYKSRICLAHSNSTSDFLDLIPALSDFNLHSSLRQGGEKCGAWNLYSLAAAAGFASTNNCDPGTGYARRVIPLRVFDRLHYAASTLFQNFQFKVYGRSNHFAISFGKLGVPSPVTGSQPGTAVYPAVPHP